MRTRLQGAMATMMLIVGSLLVVAAPAAAGATPGDEQTDVAEPEQAVEGQADSPVEEVDEANEDPLPAGEDDPISDEAPGDGEQAGGEAAAEEPAAATADETETDEPAASEDDGSQDEVDANDAAEPEDTEPLAADEEPGAPEASEPLDAPLAQPDNEGSVALAEVLSDVVPDVDVCVSDGVDWELVTTDPDSAQAMIDQEGAQWPIEDGCLVRLCRLTSGKTFPAWYTNYATPSDAAWILQQSASAYVPDQGAPCPANELVTICRFKGLDYNEVQVDPHDANWLLANEEAMLPGESGCLVRVCRLKTGEFFTFWHSLQATPEDAQWILSKSPSSYLPKQGAACPGNEPVTICQLLGIDYKPQQFDPQTAEWLLKTDADYALPGESGCLKRICVAEGDPYETWSTEYVEPSVAKSVSLGESLSFQPQWGEPCPDNGTILICDENGKVIEVDPQAANDMVNGDSAVEPTEGECPVPEATPTPEPTPKEEATPPPAKQDDGEVLGESQTRQELAETGAESTHMALVGFLLIFGGLGLVATSRVRRPA